MRWLLWTDAPWDTTAYGRQARDITARLKADGHEVAILAKHGLSGAAIRWHGTVVYPPHSKRLGVDAIKAACEHFNADIVMTIYDVWAFPPDIYRMIPVPWIAYFPLDNVPVPPRAIQCLAHADYVTTYTMWASDELERAGIANTYMPPGFDFKLFKPVNAETKALLRRKLRLPQDGFIVTSVGANKGFPCRKAWGEVVQALSAFLRSHGDTYAYIHTMLTPIQDGMNFVNHFERLGIESERVIYAPQDAIYMGIGDDQMAEIYQASDVLLAPSKAEGFGFPVLEAQACGVPVITQDAHAHGEINIYGTTVPTAQRMWIPSLEYYWDTPSVPDVLNALEYYYEHRDMYELNESRGLLEARYGHDAVWEQRWRPFIERVEVELW
jgi:glycosyltransferase involved in cell wall biosynthesis